jgi:cell shape-determining protein MreD
MIAPLTLFSLLGLGLFYVQNLLPFPQVHLRLLSLLVFFVGLRPSLALALSLALLMGLLQDSYATTPLGLHLGGSLVLVAAARLFRRLLQGLGSQIMASLAALVLQELWFLSSTLVLGYQGVFLGELTTYHGVELLGTAALGPLMNLLVRGLEKSLSRFGWRPLAESS